MLAEATAVVLGQAKVLGANWLKEKTGIYHLAGRGAVSRLDWARAILDLDAAKDEQRCRLLEAAKTADFPTPAQRPLFSALDCRKFTDTFGLRLPSWQTALRLVIG